MELLAHSKCPGKLLISGEHSTVYGKNAVAVTVDLYTFTRVYTNPEPSVTLKLNNFHCQISWSIETLSRAPSVLTPTNETTGEKDKATFVFNEQVLQTVNDLLPLASTNDRKDCSKDTPCDNSCLAFLLLYLSITESSFYYERKSIIVEIDSNMPNGAGLGSSSSYIVSLAGALFDAYNFHVEKEVLNRWCFEVDKLFHGKPSGVDNTICTYGGALLFRQGKIVERIAHDDLAGMGSMNVLLVNTGVSRNTKAMVEKCRNKLCQLPDDGKQIIDRIGDISQQIWDCMKDNHFAELPDLFTANQELLNEIGVGHEKIDEIVNIAKSYGYSAKLTGAGGGGIVFVYIPNDADITDLISELKDKHFETYNVKIGVAGVESLPDDSE